MNEPDAPGQLRGQGVASVNALPGGALLVSFTSPFDPAGGGTLVGGFARVFDASGLPLGPSFDLGQSGCNNIGAFEADFAAGGSLLASWIPGPLIGERGGNFVLATAPGTCDAPPGSDAVLGSEGADVQGGSTFSDALPGNRGGDALFGLAAGDNLSGGPGNDVLDGGAGADRMIGGLGDDFHQVDDSGDLVLELPDQGQDFVFVIAGAWTVTVPTAEATYLVEARTALTGTVARDVPVANPGRAPTLDGAAGDDALFGSAGADVFVGGAGYDTHHGDGAADRCAFNAPGWGFDLVSVLDRAAGPKLDLRGSGVTSFARLSNRSEANTQITASDGSVICPGLFMTTAASSANH